jgi:hypothetical protein
MNNPFCPDETVVHASNEAIYLKVFFPERETLRLAYLCKRIVSYCHGNDKSNFPATRYSMAQAYFTA